MSNELFSGPANLVVPPHGFAETVLAWQPLQAFTGLYGRISRGGRVRVTHEAVIFEAHGMNLTQGGVRIPISEITDVATKQRMAAALVVITTTDGTTTELVSWQRDKIKAAITSARNGRVA